MSYRSLLSSALFLNLSFSTLGALPPEEKGFSPFCSPLLAPLGISVESLEELDQVLDHSFYQIDPFVFEKKEEALPSSFSVEFMDGYLQKVYEKRKDSFLLPQPHLIVDGLICGVGRGAFKVRLMALKRTLDLGWNFRKVHIITRSEREKEAFIPIIEELFPDPHSRPSFHYILTHQSQRFFEDGCKKLKYQEEIAPHYLILESSELFSSKAQAKCRKVLQSVSTCLGCHTFPISCWREEARIHGYTDTMSEEQLVRFWFHSHMQFFSRQVHFDLCHSGELDEREQFLSSQISRASLPESTQAESFKKLALLYRERALCAPHYQVSFIPQILRAFGLIHYLKHLPHLPGSYTDILCQKILYTMNQSISPSLDWKQLFSQSSSLRKQLKELRTYTAKQILSAETSVDELLTSINQKRDLLFTQIIEHGERLLGPAPCEYSVILYGSSGRNEATPYSDLEFGILYEQHTSLNQHYFQVLSSLILMQIMDLSETPLFQCNLPCFNQKSPTDPKCQWFIDTIIPRGLSIDIIEAPHASKLPVATGKGLPLMGTAPYMALLHLDLMKKEYFGYTNLSTRYVYGSQKLFNEYLLQKKQVFKGIDSSLLLQTLEEAISDYSLTFVRAWDQRIDFKKTFYRPLSVCLEALGDLLDLDEVSSLGKVCELFDLGYIDDDEKDTLTHYLNEVFLLRLTLQVQRGGQYEGMDQDLCPLSHPLFQQKENSVAIIKKLNSQWSGQPHAL